MLFSSFDSQLFILYSIIYKNLSFSLLLGNVLYDTYICTYSMYYSAWHHYKLQYCLLRTPNLLQDL